MLRWNIINYIMKKSGWPMMKCQKNIFFVFKLNGYMVYDAKSISDFGSLQDPLSKYS